MKQNYIKTFKQFVNENINENVKVPIKAWHISAEEIKGFKNTPMWYTPKIKWAKAYVNNSIENGTDNPFMYEVKITGNILTKKEAKLLGKEIGIDYEKMVTDLVNNPSLKETKKLAKLYSDKCDGFYQWDYDPINWGDGISIFVFDPKKNVKIIKKINI
jgi:hypothetical protein